MEYVVVKEKCNEHIFKSVIYSFVHLFCKSLFPNDSDNNATNNINIIIIYILVMP